MSLPRLSCLPLAIGLLIAPSWAMADSASLWPPVWRSDDGTQTTLTANWAWDINRIDNPAAGMGDDEGWRRREVGFTVKKDGIYDIAVFYDLENELLLDAAIRFETQAVFGHDFGRFRIGQMKLGSSIEGVAGNRHTSLMENALATQAFYAVDRAGVTWTLERPKYFIDAGLYDGNLDGRNEGGTQLVRAVWTPSKQTANVLHLGVAAQRDTPRGLRNVNGDLLPPAQRWSSRTGQSLSVARLLDSGSLPGVNHVDRQTLQGLMIKGPLSLQGEYFFQQTHRTDGLRDYSSNGYYLTASWMTGGLSRNYSQGTTLNPRAAKGQMATEWLLRFSRVDLNTDGITGGSAREWTAGSNLYLGPNIKLQLNYTRTRATLPQQTLSPDSIQLRTQFMF